jgi:protease IV
MLPRMEISFGREVASVVLKAFVVLVTFTILIFVSNFWYTEKVSVSDGICNIAVLPIEGVILPFVGYGEYELVTTPATVRAFMESIKDDPAIKGVMYEINSPGGAPVASEQISDIIREGNIPSLSLIGDVAASGGYMIAAAADIVLASGMSDVGSIGVTMSYLENSKQNEEEGLTYVELNSGKFKDAGNPNKPLSDEERALFEKDLSVVHDLFVKRVAELREKTVEEISTLADGSSMPGTRALEVGLIDGLGGRKMAKQVFAETLRLTEEEVIFCEYQPETFIF